MRHTTQHIGLATTLLLVPALASLSTVWIESKGQRRHSVYVDAPPKWITVRGNGHSDLDCWLYNVDGGLVDSDTDDTDYCILETSTVGIHRVTVANVGDRSNQYVVITRNKP